MVAQLLFPTLPYPFVLPQAVIIELDNNKGRSKEQGYLQKNWWIRIGQNNRWIGFGQGIGGSELDNEQGALH